MDHFPHPFNNITMTNIVTFEEYMNMLEGLQPEFGVSGVFRRHPFRPNETKKEEKKNGTQPRLFYFLNEHPFLYLNLSFGGDITFRNFIFSDTLLKSRQFGLLLFFLLALCQHSLSGHFL